LWARSRLRLECRSYLSRRRAVELEAPRRRKVEVRLAQRVVALPER
jgi:hypothetical protein